MGWGHWKETAADIVTLFLLFRLVGCNIAIMKRFLPLLMLTGLLFGQDLLNLKNGESYKGTYIGKAGEDIVFKVPLGKNIFGKIGFREFLLSGSVSSLFLKRIRSTLNFFPIWSVETIVTKNGELTYPFDIPTKELSKPDLLLLKSGNFYKGVFIDKVDKNIIFNIEGDSIHTEISIYNVDIIKTNNGEYYYPFNIPTKKEEDNSDFWKRAAETRDRIACCMILWLLITIVADPPM